jgi:transcriptional regulator of heat shock response
MSFVILIKKNYNNILNTHLKGRTHMELFDKLYDEHENVKVRFIGFTTEQTRYDFGIIYTNMFFGKPLVVCMQTGRSTLLDPKEIEDIEYLQNVFRIPDKQQAADLAEFFRDTLPQIPFETQYD